jgi:hypothetical protein
MVYLKNSSCDWAQWGINLIRIRVYRLLVSNIQRLEKQNIPGYWGSKLCLSRIFFPSETQNQGYDFRIINPGLPSGCNTGSMPPP